MALSAIPLKLKQDGTIVRPIALKPTVNSSSVSTIQNNSQMSPMVTRHATAPPCFSFPDTPRSSKFHPVDTESDTSSSVYGVTGPQPYPGVKHKGYKFSSPHKPISDTETIHQGLKLSSPSPIIPTNVSLNNQVIRQPNAELLNVRAIPASGSAYSSPAMSRRQRPHYQVFSGQPGYHKPLDLNGSSSSDYDLVPEFIDFSSCQNFMPSPVIKPRRFPVTADGMGLSPGQYRKQLSESPTVRRCADILQADEVKQEEKRGEVQRPSSGNLGQVSSSQAYGTGTIGSHDSRQSSGIHVTPSPSDSGVVELEAALREKESELATLRSTMEQNEEVIIKVYQEKEERWQQQIKGWSTRLEQSINTEQRLLVQMQRLQDERAALQSAIQNLTAEKHGLQRKCKELENELFAAKRQLETTGSKQWAVCKRCGDVLMPDQLGKLHKEHVSDENSQQTACSLVRSSTKDSGSTSLLNTFHLQPSALPAAKKSPTPAEELRYEIDALRTEVHGLRDTLGEQVSAFAEERGRWEQEKQKVIQYQKLLQNNYVHVFQRNQELEERFQTSRESSRNSSVVPGDIKHVDRSDDAKSD